MNVRSLRIASISALLAAGIAVGGAAPASALEIDWTQFVKLFALGQVDHGSDSPVNGHAPHAGPAHNKPGNDADVRPNDAEGHACGAHSRVAQCEAPASSPASSTPQS